MPVNGFCLLADDHGVSNLQVDFFSLRCDFVYNCILRFRNVKVSLARAYATLGGMKFVKKQSSAFTFLESLSRF